MTYDQWRDVRPQLPTLALEVRRNVLFNARVASGNLVAVAAQSDMDRLSVGIQWGLEVEEEAQAFQELLRRLS